MYYKNDNTPSVITLENVNDNFENQKESIIVIPDEAEINKFHEENMDEIYSKLIEKARYLLENEDEEYVCMFLYANTYLGLRRTTIKQVLTDIMNYSARPSIEKYELAAQAHELLNSEPLAGS